MALHKVLGTETEYGIVVRGDPGFNPAVASRLATSSSPRGPTSPAAIPKVGVDAPPKTEPSRRISRRGSTITKKMFERSRNMRRTLLQAMAGTFIV